MLFLLFLFFTSIPPYYSFPVCFQNNENNKEGCTSYDYDFNNKVDLADYAFYQNLDRSRTADKPDSWLVLFNENDQESIEWKNWYINLRNIPTENTLGLNTPLNEKISVSDYISYIYLPIHQYFRENPELYRKIMGIIVGYKAPGNFYLPPFSFFPTLPELSGGGGYSVSSALMNISTVSGPVEVAQGTWKTYPTAFNQNFVNISVSAKPVVNRFTLKAGWYLTSRIDGPTLEDVKRLSPTNPNILLDGIFYYDEEDEIYGTWQDLLDTKARFSQLSWQKFNSDTDFVPNAFFYGTWHRTNNWDKRKWNSDVLGPRFLAVDQNSFGATTVRSLTNHDKRFVPNVLFKGKFLSAIGATAEPTINTIPKIETLWYYLLNGRTLGESYFMACKRSNWMWELVGDPFLKVQKVP